MSIEYCHRCDVCGERAFVNWNVAERGPSEAPGWRKFTVIWGPDVLDTIPSEYEICPDCANALREGRPASEGRGDRLARVMMNTAPVIHYGTEAKE